MIFPGESSVAEDRPETDQGPGKFKNYEAEFEGKQGDVSED
jgi:hypothetical protein